MDHKTLLQILEARLETVTTVELRALLVEVGQAATTASPRLAALLEGCYSEIAALVVELALTERQTLAAKAGSKPKTDLGDLLPLIRQYLAEQGWDAQIAFWYSTFDGQPRVTSPANNRLKALLQKGGFQVTEELSHLKITGRDE